MTAHGHEPSSQALAFLKVVADDPEGLCTSWMWRNGRGGFGGADGDVYRECSHRGLLTIRAERFLLTDAGVRVLGLPSYPASDPSTWSDGSAEALYLKGYCHALAVALSRQYGYGLGVVMSGGLPLHVFAVDAEGQPIDFDGPTSKERMLSDCGVNRASFLTLTGEADLAAYVGGHDRLPPLEEGDVAMAVRYICGRPDKFEPRSAPRP
jgi:hypothetical protein